MSSREEKKLAAVIHATLVRGQLPKQQYDSVESFEPDKFDAYVDIEWLDPDKHVFRTARITISIEE